MKTNRRLKIQILVENIQWGHLNFSVSVFKLSYLKLNGNICSRFIDKNRTLSHVLDNVTHWNRNIFTNGRALNVHIKYLFAVYMWLHSRMDMNIPNFDLGYGPKTIFTDHFQGSVGERPSRIRILLQHLLKLYKAKVGIE